MAVFLCIMHLFPKTFGRSSKQRKFESQSIKKGAISILLSEGGKRNIFPFLAPFHTGSKKKYKLERKQTSHICGEAKSEVLIVHGDIFFSPNFCLKNHFCRRSALRGAKTHSIFININLSCDRAHRRFFVNLYYFFCLHNVFRFL